VNKSNVPNSPSSQFRSVLGWRLIWLAPLLLVAGCSTPNLRPFGDASKTLSISVHNGGDLAIKPLADIPLWDGNALLEPGDPKHPAKALALSWELRRKSMDAVLVYSASLVAISEAAAHSKANAAQLVGSVKELAASVPSIGVGASKAGDLMVFGLQTFVEVKAWHNMRRAIQAADPAIQLVAKGLKKDFLELSNEYESRQRDRLIQKTVALRPIERVYQSLQDQRNTKRASVAAAPSDAAVGAELARLDALVVGLEPDLTKMHAEKSQLQDSLAEGTAFFAAAGAAVDAWAEAHADLVKCFEQNRAPNLTLLIARAEELNTLIGKLKH